MNLLLLPAIVASIFLSISAEDRHLIVYKSPDRLYSECRRYLGYRGERPRHYPPEPCENYCGAVLSHLWDFRRATMEMVRGTRYFSYSSPGEDYLAECERCIQRVREMVPAGDQCRRADAHLECFAQNASVNFDRTYYVVKAPLQHRRVAQECAEILQVSEGCQRGGLLNYPEGRCLVRCFMIREKLYSEANGVTPQRVVLESDQDRDHRKVLEFGRNCVARLQREFLDRCTLAARIAAECYGKAFWKVVEDSFKEVL